MFGLWDQYMTTRGPLTVDKIDGDQIGFIGYKWFWSDCNFKILKPSYIEATLVQGQ